MTFYTLAILEDDKKGVEVFLNERDAVECWVKHVFLTKTNRTAFMKKYDKRGLEAVRDLLQAHTARWDTYILEKQELHFPKLAETLRQAYELILKHAAGQPGSAWVLNDVNGIMLFLK